MDKEIIREIEKNFYGWKPAARIRVGSRGGKPVYMIKRQCTYKQLNEKYPGGVIPKWKVVLLGIFRPRWKDNLWFSDILDGVCKRILGG